MIVFLLIWSGVLTGALVFLALAFIGKTSRDAREKAALIHDVNAELEAGKKWMNLLSGRIDKLLEIQQNLVTKVKTLEENYTYDNSTLAGSMEQIENRIAQLQETQERLRADLEKGYEERPVTAELVAMPRNKGGRPRKEGS